MPCCAPRCLRAADLLFRKYVPSGESSPDFCAEGWNCGLAAGTLSGACEHEDAESLQLDRSHPDVFKVCP